MAEITKIKRLSGKNYSSWSYNAKLVLMERGLWGIANGSEKRPDVKLEAGNTVAETDVKLIKAWQMRADKAYSLIALNVEEDLQVHISHTVDAHEAWTILKDHFKVVSVSHIVRLTRRFYAASMAEGDDLQKFITEMTQLAQELRELNEVISPKKFAIVILGSLPPSYDNFITSFNARSVDDLSWDSVKALLTEEYLKRKDRSDEQGRSQPPGGEEALFTYSNPRGGGSQNNPTRGGRAGRGGRGGQNGGRGGGGRGRYHPYNRGGGNQGTFQGTCWKCGEVGHREYEGKCVVREEGNFAGEGEIPSSSSNDVKNEFFHEDDIALSTECGNRSGSRTGEWYIDSAASRHMTYDSDILLDFRILTDEEREKCKVYLGDDSYISAVGEGKVRLATESGKFLALHNVAYVPELKKNLLSVGAMTAMGAEVRFDSKKCVVVKGDVQHTIGHCVGGKLYCVSLPPPDSAYFASGATPAPSKELWHCRYGHLNESDVNKLAKKNMVEGMKVNDKSKSNSTVGDKCEGCILGKMTKNPFPKKSMNRATKPLELVHTDLCGPLQVPSHGGNRYVLTFTDDFSRYTTIYFLRNKSDTIIKFKDYVSIMENSSGHKVHKLSIKTLRSDNGGEYVSGEFNSFCNENGITREFSNPKTPEQNGVAERYNRTMIESARSMLHHAKLPLVFWAEAVQTAVYLRNRSPTVALENKTPFECWYGRKPDVSNMRVFGSLCYVHIPVSERQKLDAKSYKGIFAGYPEGTKGYKVYNISTGKFARTRNVIFEENKFHSFESPIPNATEIVNVVLPYDDPLMDEVDENLAVLSLETGHDGTENNGNEIVNPPPLPPPEPPLPPPMQLPLDDVAATYEQTFMNQVNNLGGARIRNAPKRFDDECMFTESLLDDIAEPKTFKAACRDAHASQWEHAMNQEFNSLIKNDTWELVPRPTDKNIVGNRWVYKVKRASDGTVERFKARLVAKGYSQAAGIDYEEVFSPVARFPTLRTLLAFANAHDLEIHHMDVTTAFLNGELDCEIFMEQPEGFVDATRPDYVCKLKKGLYGLKQSARCWNNTLDEFLKSRGFVQNEADECVYTKAVKQDDGKISFIIMAVYVDDIIPVSNDNMLLSAEKRAICDEYDMVDNGEIKHCLGLIIKRDRKNKILSISQSNYIENVLVKFGMENSRPVATPLEPGVPFYKMAEGDTVFDVKTYQQAIGSLTYAAICTRPDISAAVGVLSQFMSNPNSVHWTGVKRILRYLRGTANYGLIYDGKTEVELVGYSDADWAGDVNTRRSTSGYAFQLGNATITWSSRRQQTVARSSTEAEYVALSAATQECIWLRRLVESLGIKIDLPTTIFEDNQGAIDIAKNPKHHGRTKHIDVSHHFIRERIASKEISVLYLQTGDMTADILTKGVTAVKFKKFRDCLGVMDVGRFESSKINEKKAVSWDPVTYYSD